MLKTSKSKLYLIRTVYIVSMLCLILCVADNYIHGAGINPIQIFLIAFGTGGFITLNRKFTKPE